MVKSYYAKTALLWLCEQTPNDDWTTVSQSVIKLLDFLDDAVDTGKLPCYFWSEVNLLRFTSQGDREVMKKALHDIRQNLNSHLAREFCVYKPGLQEMLTQTTTKLTERQVRVCLARWSILVGIANGLPGYLAMTTLPEVGCALAVMVRSQQLTSFDVDRLSEKYTYRRNLQFGMFKTLTVAPADVTLQADMQRSIGPDFVWDAAPLLDLLIEDDLRFLLGDPNAVRAWLRRQHQLPETERPAGLPADLRSPRGLCDLLLNIPLLSRALRESVPDKWHEYRQDSESATRTFREERVEECEVYMKNALDYASMYEDLAFDFHIRLGMDRRAALRTACRYGVELRRLCDDPETVREFERRRRRFPDPWGVLPFLLRRPL
ncbi:hypothetical protein FJT64_015665 [Amphibalanus amphitrite]|uniref:Mab-21-like HhH/H2TH-like domain-containing protein n=1 Tax=Amphibalanus amphitrite TaxID=1232801 RepID=A0A6A4XCW5_AMPAM|nr:hypothetical protein FJT64_015665 [Amphibalanus amphitrite]